LGSERPIHLRPGGPDNAGQFGLRVLQVRQRRLLYERDYPSLGTCAGYTRPEDFASKSIASAGPGSDGFRGFPTRQLRHFLNARSAASRGIPPSLPAELLVSALIFLSSRT